jgi:hypothetical protein
LECCHEDEKRFFIFFRGRRDELPFVYFSKKNYFLNFVANAFISPINTQTMHIKSLYTQLKTRRDSNPGLLGPEAHAMTTSRSFYKKGCQDPILRLPNLQIQRQR